MNAEQKQKIASLPTSFQTLIMGVHEQDEMDPDKAKELLQAANISKEDAAPWADFDHPVEDCYGRKLVYHGGFFEVMVMSWPPGDFSSIHDHGHTEWGAVQFLGDAEHAVFALKDGILRTVRRDIIKEGSVNSVNHELIHQMGNHHDSNFLSIHMYGCYDLQDEITGDSRIWELHEETIQFTSGGVFFALPADQISRTEPGVKGDFVSTLRHNVELLRRLRKIHRAGRGSADIVRRIQTLERSLFADTEGLSQSLAELTDENGNIIDLYAWSIFWHDVQVAVACKGEELTDYVS